MSRAVCACAAVSSTVWSVARDAHAGACRVVCPQPLMLVAFRFVLAALVAWVLARVIRGPLRVTRADAVRIGLSGFVLNGVVQRTIFRMREDVEDKINARAAENGEAVLVVADDGRGISIITNA